MSQLSVTFKRLTNETFTSFAVRNYRLYYIGQIISTSGTFMQSVAQAWLVLKLTNSGTALGIVSALQYIPILLFGTVGGVMADRFPKRTVLYFTQAAAGLLGLTLGVLVATNLVTLWMVYILAFLLGWVTVFDNPARQTFVLELVGESRLRNAVTLYSTLVNLSRVIGPTLAALLIASIGLAPCFILNGLSYGAVVIMLSLMRASELHVTPPITATKGQLREGINYVRTTPILLNTLLMLFVVGMLTFEFQVSLPLLAQYTFNSGASGYAFLSACLGMGAVVGGLAVASQRKYSPALLVIAAFLFGATVLTAAIMPTLYLSGLLLVLAGACSIYFTSLGNTILQLSSSPQMRGRVMSFWSMAFLGSTTIGGPLVGWFAQTFGDRWGLAIGGLAGLAAGLLGLINLRNSHSKADHPD
ncbi:MAG: MFS transporter [Anaerolineales bacterium]|nr:MFS transporter [Anaerolineae bacterium]PWB55697.1 MAG: MFS transporter [Anaerolineales bacterium]